MSARESARLFVAGPVLAVLLAWSAMAGAAVERARAEDAPPGATEVPLSGPQPPASPAGPARPVPPDAQSVLVRLSLFESDIRDALNELATQTGINILATPDVSGNVTAELAGVPLEVALETLLAPFGYAYRWTGTYYLVGVPDPRNLAFGALVESAVIPVVYGDASKIAGMLSEYYRTFVKADPDGRRLMVTGPASVIQQVRRDVELLDRPPAELQVRVVVTELTRRAAQELGIDESSYDPSGTGGLGLSLSPSGVELTYAQLMARLKVLADRQEASVRADPDVRITEGRTFSLFAGQRQFFLISAPDTTARLQEIESGVRLNLTARLLEAGQVMLTVAPSVSHLVPGDEVIPALESSELSTTVRLRGGQTAVLATMTLDRSLTGEQQAPGLGDLPLVGWLFRRENREESRRRLVIFLTPEVLEPPGAKAS